MIKACALAVSFALGLTAFGGGAAFADKGHGHGLFERADKDGDGFVTQTEFNAGRAVMFAKLDANGDGAIDQAEIDQMRAKFHKRHKPDATPGQQADQQAQHVKTHRSFMERMDADHDGKVRGAEFAAAGARMFAKLDDNGDGRIAQEELPRRHKRHDATQPSQ